MTPDEPQRAAAAKTVVAVTPEQRRDLERGSGFATIRGIGCPECGYPPPLILERGKGGVAVCYTCRRVVDTAVEKEETMPKRTAPSSDELFGHDEPAPEVKEKLALVQSEFALFDEEKHIVEVMTHSPLFQAVLERVYGLRAAGATKTGGKRYELPLPAE